MISNELKAHFRDRLESESLNYIAQQTGIGPPQLSRWNRGLVALSQRNADILAGYLSLKIIPKSSK